MLTAPLNWCVIPLTKELRIAMKKTALIRIGGKRETACGGLVEAEGYGYSITGCRLEVSHLELLFCVGNQTVVRTTLTS